MVTMGVFPRITIVCAHIWEASSTARFQDALIIVGKKTVPFGICFLPRAAISRNVNSSLREDFHCYTSLPPTAPFFPSAPKMVAVGFYQMLSNLFRTGHGHILEDGNLHCCLGHIPCYWVAAADALGRARTWRRQGGRFLRWSVSYL